MKKNPDVIGLITMGQSEEQAKQVLAEMRASDSWNQTKAVQQGRVYILPSPLFTVNPGSQVGEALRYLSDILYDGGRS